MSPYEIPRADINDFPEQQDAALIARKSWEQIAVVNRLSDDVIADEWIVREAEAILRGAGRAIAEERARGPIATPFEVILGIDPELIRALDIVEEAEAEVAKAGSRWTAQLGQPDAFERAPRLCALPRLLRDEIVQVADAELLE